MVTSIPYQKSSFSLPKAAVIVGAVGVCAWLGGIPSAVTALVTLGVTYCTERTKSPMKKAHLPKVAVQTQTESPKTSTYETQTETVKPAVAQRVEPPMLSRQIDSLTPIGLRNTNGANCAFNSIIQYFEFDPRVAYMARNPISDQISMNDFVQFLADQGAPDDLIKEFQNSYSDKERILPSFFAFIEKKGIHKIFGMGFSGDTFLRLLSLRRPYFEISRAYDEARKTGIGAAKTDSQILRSEITKFMPGEFPVGRFVDAHAAGQFILDLLPVKKHMQVYEKYVIGDRVLGVPKAMIQSFIQLEIPKGEKNPHMTLMFQNYCDSKELVEDLDRIKGNNVMVDLKRRFSVAPAVHFHIKRFKYVDGKRLKIDTPVQVPEEVSIPMQPQGEKKYRIAAFIRHSSSPEDADFGHYVACMAINDQYYLANDSKISKLSKADWQAHLNRAYLICYTAIN